MKIYNLYFLIEKIEKSRATLHQQLTQTSFPASIQSNHEQPQLLAPDPACQH